MMVSCDYCGDDVEGSESCGLRVDDETVLEVCEDCHREHGGDEEPVDEGDQWEYPQGALLLRTSDDTVWHVTGRVEDVDDGTRFYRLEDATHTTMQWYHAEDVEPAPEATLPGTHVLLRESLPAGLVKPVELDLVRHLRE